MPYNLGGKTFRTKASIKSFFKDYHKDKNNGHLLEEPHYSVMCDLITRHPRHSEWEIVHPIQLRVNVGKYGEKNYQILRFGGWETFSYNKCIKGDTPEKNVRCNVLKAMRNAVEPQKNKFLAENLVEGQYRCNTCRGMFDDVDVDHNFKIITFQRLVDDFLIGERKRYADVGLADVGLADLKEGGWSLTEEDHISWCKYHEENAILQCLCKNCHWFKK